MEMSLTMTIIKMRNALNWTATKWCTHADWTKFSTWKIPKHHMSSVPSISKSIYWRPGGGGTACVECVGRGLVVTLGLAKSTTPESIKSCIAWWSAEQCSVSCPGIWWYKQCSCKRKWGGIGWGKGLGAKGTITPASLSFSKALVKVIPNGVNCLAGLYAYGLGGGWVAALGCGGRGCTLV